MDLKLHILANTSRVVKASLHFKAVHADNSRCTKIVGAPLFELIIDRFEVSEWDFYENSLYFTILLRWTHKCCLGL